MNAAAIAQIQAQTQVQAKPHGPDAANSTARQQARAAAEAFEATFLAQVLGSMFSGIKTDGPFGAGPGADIYRSMQNEQYANAIAQQGGIGIADQIYAEILKLQEVGGIADAVPAVGGGEGGRK